MKDELNECIVDDLKLAIHMMHLDKAGS